MVRRTTTEPGLSGGTDRDPYLAKGLDLILTMTPLGPEASYAYGIVNVW